MKSRNLPLLALLIAIFLMPTATAAGANDGETADLARLSSVLRQDVRGPSGILLGAVEDVIIGRGGSPSFLVLSRGSAFGNVGPYHVVPWQMAAPKLEKNKVVIAFGPKIIGAAPAIRMKSWKPASVSPEHLKQVLAYYGQVLQRDHESSLP
ncbi:MAG: PRC-barrel domain-containing protein [Deltaproteobacteria bacterium]|jgi:hypothetical protein